VSREGCELDFSKETGAALTCLPVHVRPVCVPAPPGVFLPVQYRYRQSDPENLPENQIHVHSTPPTADAQTILNAASARMLRVSFGVM